VEGIDAEGHPLWSLPTPPGSEVGLSSRGATLAVAGPEGVLTARVFDGSGAERASCAIAAGAEAVSLRVLEAGGGTPLVAACTGPLSACADRSVTSGPYNRLWSCESEDSPLEIMSRSDVYFDIAGGGGSEVVVAASGRANTTEVFRIDPALGPIRIADLAGRRMLGPIAGPGGIWLVATCNDLSCQAPFRLFAISVEEDG
jgi:hypothetical protein